MSENLNEQLDKDLSTCRWFSIQCDESVDSSSTAQLMVFIRMVFADFSTKEELLTLIPLRTTTRGVDIYNAIKTFFVEKKVPLEKLVSVTTDGAPGMVGWCTGNGRMLTQTFHLSYTTTVSSTSRRYARK
ncbi:hypothetical protein AAFF_G00337470 [Aldrovandia affinis]|uniref:DUF4371 domain-containing protein n=1 Tax=Aldrovandia affinis TaxID=143900 RepID=A0AAD7SKU0_9TELE|nr:hypothetical protein AAFF_G00337470 [Aldrovandia affinis]